MAIKFALIFSIVFMVGCVPTGQASFNEEIRQFMNDLMSRITKQRDQAESGRTAIGEHILSVVDSARHSKPELRFAQGFNDSFVEQQMRRIANGFENLTNDFADDECLKLSDSQLKVDNNGCYQKLATKLIEYSRLAAINNGLVVAEKQFVGAWLYSSDSTPFYNFYLGDLYIFWFQMQ